VFVYLTFVWPVIGLDDVPQAYRDLLEGHAPALKTIIRP
jgi:hypothetical protein